MTTRSSASRRSFIRTAGAALSVPLATAATTVPASATVEGDPLKTRLARLEDLEAIRGLNREYARHVNAGARDSITALFADPSDVDIEPEVHGIGPDGFGEEDLIEIAPDGQTATALMHRTVEVERVIGPECPLIEMARQQGGGVVRQTERRVVENVYVRVNGSWKIDRSSFRSPTTASSSNLDVRS